MIRNTKVYGLSESCFAARYAKFAKMPTQAEFEELKALEKNTALAQRLGCTPIGSGHDCFLKGVVVQADFIFSQGWWMQAQRYRDFCIVSSQSKEHCCKEIFGYDDPDAVPMGAELGARVTTNYLQLKTMYAQRKHHRRREWGEFCDWCKHLPLFREITQHEA